MGMDGTLPNIAKAIYQKLNANIILNGENLKASSKDLAQGKAALSSHSYSI